MFHSRGLESVAEATDIEDIGIELEDSGILVMCFVRSSIWNALFCNWEKRHESEIKNDINIWLEGWHQQEFGKRWNISYKD